MEKVKSFEAKQVETVRLAETELDDTALDAVAGGCEKSDELFAAVSSILKQQHTVNLAVLKMIRF